MAKIGENFPDVPRRRRAPRSKGLDAAVRTRTSVFPECAHNLRTAGPKCWHYYVIWRSCISYMIIQSFLNLFLQDLFSCIARTSFCFFAWYVAVLYFWMIRASVIHSAVLNACSTNALKIKIYYTIPVQRICFFQNIFMHLYGNLWSFWLYVGNTSYDVVACNPIEGYTSSTY